jgi:hypothetical protein
VNPWGLSLHALYLARLTAARIISPGPNESAMDSSH